MPRPPRLIMAFDFGLRCIGVAVGNELLGSASALTPLAAREGVPDWQGVQRLLGQWQPRLLLVGLPLNMDGSPSDMSQRAERFARRLHGRFGLPCEMVDERLSSFEARTRLYERGQSAAQTEAHVDSEAACIILETWFAGADTH